MMKKVVALVLTVCMLMGATCTAFAYWYWTDCETDHASYFIASSWSALNEGDPYVDVSVEMDVYINGSYFCTVNDDDSSFALAEVSEPGPIKTVNAEGRHYFYYGHFPWPYYDYFVSADSDLF